MNFSLNKKFKSYLLIISIIVVALIILCLHFFPKILVTGAQNAQLKRLNNPYIGKEYSGWKKVKFFDSDEFSIPPEWDISAIDNSTYSMLKDGIVIAYVGKLGNDTKYSDTNVFCSSIAEIQSVESPYLDAIHGEHFGNGCNAYKITAMNRKKLPEQYYYLITGHHLNECAVLFLNDLYDCDELLDYVIAICYSYEFHQS